MHHLDLHVQASARIYSFISLHYFFKFQELLWCSWQRDVIFQCRARPTLLKVSVISQPQGALSSQTALPFNALPPCSTSSSALSSSRVVPFFAAAAAAPTQAPDTDSTLCWFVCMRPVGCGDRPRSYHRGKSGQEGWRPRAQRDCSCFVLYLFV